MWNPLCSNPCWVIIAFTLSLCILRSLWFQPSLKNLELSSEEVAPTIGFDISAPFFSSPTFSRFKKRSPSSKPVNIHRLIFPSFSTDFFSFDSLGSKYKIPVATFKKKFKDQNQMKTYFWSFAKNTWKPMMSTESETSVQKCFRVEVILQGHKYIIGRSLVTLVQYIALTKTLPWTKQSYFFQSS